MAKRIRRVFRRFKTKRRRGPMTIPIAAVGGALAGVFITTAGGRESPLTIAMRGDFPWAMHELLYNYTGYHAMDGKWDITKAQGLWAAVAGMVAHIIAGKLGINRALGRAKVPFIRI